MKFFGGFCLVIFSCGFVQCQINCYDGAKTDKVNEELLQETNSYRSSHNVPALKLDSSLIKDSIEWSRRAAEQGAAEPSKPKNHEYGENLKVIFSSKCSFNNSIHEPVRSWYEDGKYYIEGVESDDRSAHYTQLIWKNTQKMGCGVCSSDEGSHFVVCRYVPAGNIVGKYKENVLPEGGKLSQDEAPNSTTRATRPTLHDKESTALNITLFLIGVVVLALTIIPVVITGLIMINSYAERQ